MHRYWIPQSDDQFKLLDWCIRKGVSFQESFNEKICTLTVPSLGVHDAKPFDYKLHEVVKSLEA